MAARFYVAVAFLAFSPASPPSRRRAVLIVAARRVYRLDVRYRIVLLVVAAAVVAGCTSTQQTPPATTPLTTTPRSEAAGAAVARRPIEAPAAPSGAAPKIVVPPNTQYVCVTDTKDGRQQTAIEFAPKVADLCRKHPEMGPCQYERNNCRASGGRVFAADDAEITPATEAEYDKKVMRVRLRAN